MSGDGVVVVTFRKTCGVCGSRRRVRVERAINDAEIEDPDRLIPPGWTELAGEGGAGSVHRCPSCTNPGG